MTLSDQRGASLAEMMVSLAVVLCVLGLTTQILMQSGRAFTDGQARMENRNNNAAGIDMMERLIRQATTIVPDPDNNGVFDSIRVVHDWNPRDGAVTGPYETVTFSTAGGLLLMQDSTMAAPAAFAEGVTALGFTYANYQGAPMTTAAVAAQQPLIGMVTVTMTTPAVNGAAGASHTVNVGLRRIK